MSGKDKSAKKSVTAPAKSSSSSSDPEDIVAAFYGSRSTPVRLTDGEKGYQLHVAIGASVADVKEALRLLKETPTFPPVADALSIVDTIKGKVVTVQYAARIRLKAQGIDVSDSRLSVVERFEPLEVSSDKGILERASAISKFADLDQNKWNQFLQGVAANFPEEDISVIYFGLIGLLMRDNLISKIDRGVSEDGKLLLRLAVQEATRLSIVKEVCRMCHRFASAEMKAYVEYDSSALYDDAVRSVKSVSYPGGFSSLKPSFFTSHFDDLLVTSLKRGLDYQTGKGRVSTREMVLRIDTAMSVLAKNNDGSGEQDADDQPVLNFKAGVAELQQFALKRGYRVKNLIFSNPKQNKLFLDCVESWGDASFQEAADTSAVELSKILDEEKTASEGIRKITTKMVKMHADAAAAKMASRALSRAAEVEISDAEILESYRKKKKAKKADEEEDEDEE